jgi:hypothetical protein
MAASFLFSLFFHRAKPALLSLSVPAADLEAFLTLRLSKRAFEEKGVSEVRV